MTKDVDKMELQIESEIENLMNVSSNLLVIITTLSALLASNLLGTAKLLLLVLGLLAKLGRSASLSSSKGLTNEAVLGLVIKSILKGIVDASETSGLLATECGSEAENEDGLVIVDLELLSNKGANLLLGNSAG